MALDDKKNYTQRGKPTAQFKRSKLYKLSQKKWYKLYEEKLGEVTAATTKPIQSGVYHVMCMFVFIKTEHLKQNSGRRCHFK